LEEAITAEIEQLGNQSEVDAVLANVEEARLEIVHKNNKPKGRFKDVEARISNLQNEIAVLRDDQDELASDIDALNEAERTLRSLEDSEAEEDLKARLDDLEHKRAGLVRRKEIEAKIAAARLRVERLLMTRDQRQKRSAERVELTAELDQRKQEESELRAQLTEREAELESQYAKRQILAEADDAVRQKRLSLEQLNTELKQRGEIENALRAVATEVTIDLDGNALDQVRLDGRTLDQPREVVQVVDGLEIDIRNVGRIKVHPKVDQLEQLREHRATLDRSVAGLVETLGLENIEPESMEALWRETEEETAGLAGNRTELDGIVTDLEKVASEKRHATLALATRRQQVEERLAAINDEIRTDHDSDGQTDEELVEAEAELVAAQDVEKTLSVDLEPSSLTLDQLEADIKSLRLRIDQRARDISGAKLRIERLSARVAVRAGRGLDERLDECLRRLDLLTQEQARFQLDVHALSLLKDTLIEAANDAKAHFHAPLAARLTPYLQSLLPDADLEVTPDFGIAAVHRGQPAAERFEQLSDGTREQIAILARLAFARMLQEQGLPALVVLDDALVFSDQQRLDRMFDILENAAKMLQIIILTCREDRFLDLKAKRLQIEQRAAAA
jgi:chromosome segregation ATPase